MRKIIVVLSCIGLMVMTGCRNKREEERRRMEIERIRQDHEATRLADEQRLLELQMCARKDTAAKSTRSARAYYVVIGSFKVSGNAYAYSSSMQSTFNSVSVVSRRGWHFVTVGGPFGSRGTAVRMLNTVMGTSVAPAYSPIPVDAGGDEDVEEDYSDEEEEITEEEYTDEETGDEEGDEEEVGSDMEEEMEDEPVEAPMPVSTGFSGQAWVMVL